MFTRGGVRACSRVRSRRLPKCCLQTVALIATPGCRGQESAVRYAVRPFLHVACIEVPTPSQHGSCRCLRGRTDRRDRRTVPMTAAPGPLLPRSDRSGLFRPAAAARGSMIRRRIRGLTVVGLRPPGVRPGYRKPRRQPAEIPLLKSGNLSRQTRQLPGNAGMICL